MSIFENYFSHDHIVRELCKARVSLAGRRHEALFFHDIDKTQRSAEEVPMPECWREIPIDIFPPRKVWNRYRPRHRSGQDRDIHLETLVRAVRHLSKERPEAAWLKRLRETVGMIRGRALSDAPFAFSAPTIVPVEKGRYKETYRPVASFALSDRIIDCLTARYFRETLDSALLDSCLAFRPGRDGRHQGLDTILRQRHLHSDTGLFVAECDIQGFYDCVSHDVARNALNELIADAQRLDPGLDIDPRSLEIFDAYLSCYSFLRNIRQQAELKLKKKHPQATYPWCEQKLREFYGASAAIDGIGVPQGGSLSSLIANAVLHSADKDLQPFCASQGVMYLRYCDDTILLAPEREACEEAFSRYREVLTNLRLPIHEPEPLKAYQGSQKKKFWRAKSKSTYHWSDPCASDAYLWIQFLGYQIRYDGAVRIRPSSIAKEHSKLAEVTGKTLSLLQPSNVSNIRRSANSIEHRLRMKVISMAVGRRDIGQSSDKPLPKCWANGFRWLSGKNIITNNLKALDRQRERQINRVNRRLRILDLQIPEKEEGHQRRRKYYGFPFSYRGQFERATPSEGVVE
jgi:hypothetical protein